jgi:hypothetical protein
MQAFCDVDKRFWNVWANQPREFHNGEQFKMSNIYGQLKNHEILQELMVVSRV